MATQNFISDTYNEIGENQDSLFSTQEIKPGSNHDNVNLFENLYAISVKRRGNRSNTDKRVICKALKTIKFFADMQKDDMDFDSFILQSFELMEYEDFEKDEAVFHLGDVGDKFYIILKGSVDVYVPKTQEEIMNDTYLESENKRYHLNLNHIRQAHFEATSSDNPGEKTPDKQRNSLNPSSKKLIPHNEEIGDEGNNRKRGGISTYAKLKIKSSNYANHLNLTNLCSKFEDKKNLYFENGNLKFKKVRTMEAGACFGEIALSSNMTRGASVIASSPLHVVTLSKNAYKQIFKNVETSLKAKWNFFSELLKGTSKETVTKFCYTFKERIYKFNQKILEEGEIPRQVFVIHEGEVQVVKQEKKDEKNDNELKYFKKQKKLAEKKLVNLGPFCFIGEGEVLNHKKPYEYSAISMTNNTVIYSTSIKDFNTLRMDHGDAFLKIFNKHQTKMEHWNARSASSLYNSTHIEDGNLNNHIMIDDLANTKSNSPGILRSHVKHTHSSRFIGDRLKMMLNRDSFRNSHTEDENSSTNSREGYSIERKKTYNESKPGTVMSTSIFHQNKLVKLFDDKKTNSTREKSLKGSLRDLKKEKKSVFARDEDYILDDEENAQKSSSVERFIKRKTLTSKNESPSSLLVSPKHFLPHESDLQKIRMKTNASPVRRMNFRKRESLTQNSNYEDETSNLINSMGPSNRLDITGQKLNSYPFGENNRQQQILDELRQQEKASLDFRQFLNNVVSTKTANEFWSPKSELTQTQTQTEKLTKTKSKDAIERNSQFNNTLSNGFIKKNHSTLQMSKFPVFDSIPALAKMDSFGIGPTTNSYEELEPAANTGVEFYLKPKDKSATVISSKHNLFRMKPKKAFLEYSHYLSPSSNSSLSPQKIHRNLRYKK